MASLAPEAHDNTLDVGEFREAAMWYSTPEQRDKAKEYIKAAFEYDEIEHGAVFSPIEFSDEDPSRRAPNPPEREAKLLVGKARLWATR